jgi:superfamily II DNA or RNA helicase
MKLYGQLKPGYQKRAVNKNFELIKEVLDGRKKGLGRQVTTSPTGSGKTFMMASIIELGLTHESNPCFVWLTHNKQILNQTESEVRQALDSFLTPVANIEANIQQYGGRVLLFNVQKGVSDKAKSWLKKWQKYQHDLSRKIIFIIDEADEGMSGQNMESLKQTLKPVLELGFTASFKKKDDEYEFEKVTYNEVIEAGMLVQKIYWQASDEVTRIEVMKRAVEQRNYLEAQAHNLHSIGRYFLPKMLIQTKASEAESVARELRLLINLSDKDFKEQVVVHVQESRGLDQIENLDKVKYVIGDMMVERGWNCPEAYVLLSTKGSLSKAKGIQLMGRVIRLPKCEPFDEAFDAFNSAYVYVSGKHSIEQSCEGFGEDGVALPPPKEVVQVDIRTDIRLPNLLTFKNQFVDDIEGDKFFDITEKICSVLENFKKESHTYRPSIAHGHLDLTEMGYTSKVEEIETEWDREQAKKLLIDALAKHVPRSYSNLVIVNFQIKNKLSELAPIAKILAKKIEETSLIKKIVQECSFVFEYYKWPAHKLIVANPNPLICDRSLYSKVQVNSEEKEFVKFIEDVAKRYNFYWVRNDPSDVKLFKGHYPDFIAFNGDEFIYIEFKGKHLLNSKDTVRKLIESSKLSYLMVYLAEDKKTLMVKNQSHEIDEKLLAEHFIQLKRA